MNARSIDLKPMREPLHVALGAYERLHDGALRFGDAPEFTRTHGKPNYARAVTPAKFRGDIIGDFYAIVFLPGDGTGDAGTYKTGELQVPQRLRYMEKLERVFPRAKSCAAEGFFPLFSMEDGNPGMFEPYLEELIVGNIGRFPGIVHGWEVGRNYKEIETEPRVYFTVGIKDGRRFGDPHAMHYPAGSGTGARVAGFLAVPESALELTRDWILPKEYR